MHRIWNSKFLAGLLVLAFAPNAAAQDAEVETEETVTMTVTVKTKKKKGGKKGPAAKKQKAGENLTTTGSKQAGETYLGVTCDASMEGAAWCDTETEVAFCSGGVWYLMDCSALDELAWCGYDEAYDVVDCFVDY